MELQLSSEEAKQGFLELCQKAPQMRNFPWQAMIRLGKQAKFDKNVTLYADDPTEQRNLCFSPETIIRCLLGPWWHRQEQRPIIKKTWDVVMVTSYLYGKFRIYQSCQWLPMFLAFVDWKHSRRS